jgi:WD40 repeat protein
MECQKRFASHKLSHQGEVLDIAITPDGSWIATGSRDRTAVIWNAKNGKPIINGLLHAQGVRNVQFSPDGTQLLTSSFDGLRLWDVATGHPLTVTIKDPLSGGTGFQSTSGRGGFSPMENWSFEVPIRMRLCFGSSLHQPLILPLGLRTSWRPLRDKRYRRRHVGPKQLNLNGF